ncbi:copper homeostasis protein CutC [Acidomonas methanolica]|uniref:copper homeostasis protein CutC n=1 Tax=Acidomonas methanolica TaxID=437 RepID=UPI00211A6342|nr:copper homeostasis protein CutC [Acidomonas methanolica]MCQ9156906.1 copper homeostasis protein CutC [Acidomonas methanolica]
MTELEICVDDAEGVRTAQQAEVTRIELCAALALGGLTPSAGLVHLARGSAVPVYAMIRPRSGAFVFDTMEERAMLAEIAAMRTAGLAGVVLGASLPDHRLDVPLLARLSAAAGPLGRTLHRAFDLAPDPFEALEAAIALGFERILTSGGAHAAPEGAPLLRALVTRAAGRIEIMAGAGVTPGNVVPLLRATGVGAVHASCRAPAAPEPERVAAFGFGATRATTSPGTIHAMRDALSSFDTSLHSTGH